MQGLPRDRLGSQRRVVSLQNRPLEHRASFCSPHASPSASHGTVTHMPAEGESSKSHFTAASDCGAHEISLLQCWPGVLVPIQTRAHASGSSPSGTSQLRAMFCNSDIHWSAASASSLTRATWWSAWMLSRHCSSTSAWHACSALEQQLRTSHHSAAARAQYAGPTSSGGRSARLGQLPASLCEDSLRDWVASPIVPSPESSASVASGSATPHASARLPMVAHRVRPKRRAGFPILESVGEARANVHCCVGLHRH